MLCAAQAVPNLARGGLLKLAPVPFWYPPSPRIVFECFLVFHKVSQAHLINSVPLVGISHLSLVHFSWGVVFGNHLIPWCVPKWGIRKGWVLYFLKNIWVDTVSNSNFKVQNFSCIFSYTKNLFKINFCTIFYLLCIK